jgi:serine/threonine protein kinase
VTLASGSFIGHYEMLHRLGAGGMGEVYGARDTKLGRNVALKIPETVAGDPEPLARFQREAMALASEIRGQTLLVRCDGTIGRKVSLDPVEPEETKP